MIKSWLQKYRYVVGDLNPRTSDLETNTLPPHHQAVLLRFKIEKKNIGIFQNDNRYECLTFIILRVSHGEMLFLTFKKQFEVFDLNAHERKQYMNKFESIIASKI